MDKSSRTRSARAFMVVAAVVGLLATACSNSTNGSPTSTVAATGSNNSASQSPAGSSAPKTTAPPAAPVHVEGFPDGDTVGVGMPIIATFNKKITEAKDFVKNTTVTVNGQPANGAWYFEYSDPKSGHVMEAHYREKNYWPAHAHIHVTFNLKGISAGKGLAFDGKLTSIDFSTGPANIAVVNDATHKMTITTDGQPYGTFPVSLGANNTPTYRGIKVIMEKVPTVCMHDTDNTYYECGIKWDQRLTYSGEYLHSAPWNVSHIENGIDSSNGCTNLLPADAVKLYNFLRIGDVVQYPNASGPMMTMGAGYGDWNVNWTQWQTGGALATS